MPGITPRHGKNRPHGECKLGGSCEKARELRLTAYGSWLWWPHMWLCYAVTGAWPCGGDTGGVTSAVRHEAAGMQQPDRRSCGHGRRGLAIRGRGRGYEGAFPRKQHLVTPFVRSTHQGALAAIADWVELNMQSHGRCVLTAEASRGGGGPVLSAAAICRSLRGPLAKRTPTSMALESLL